MISKFFYFVCPVCMQVQDHSRGSSKLPSPGKANPEWPYHSWGWSPGENPYWECCCI